MNIREILDYGTRFLRSGLDARILLQYMLSISHEQLIMHDSKVLTDLEFDSYKQLLDRRKNLEPIAYITSVKEFFSREFYVTNDVLIPRPDTEILVESAIDLCAQDSPFILDMGVGSGCIIISLLLEIQGSTGIGIDISTKAMAVARINAKKYNLEGRLQLVRSFGPEEI